MLSCRLSMETDDKYRERGVYAHTTQKFQSNFLQLKYSAIGRFVFEPFMTGRHNGSSSSMFPSLQANLSEIQRPEKGL